LPVQPTDLIREGKLLEVHCDNFLPERHLYIDAGSLGLPKRGREASGLLEVRRQEQRDL
jgi:hypothetical protein